MPDFDVGQLARFDWRPSRIPALDGLVTFLKDGERDPAVEEFARSRPSRWYPEEGGTRVVVLYDDGAPYDASRWRVEKGAWDHEHCDLCGESIEPMTLCWVTKRDPYALLCQACHAKVAGTSTGDVSGVCPECEQGE